MIFIEKAIIFIRIRADLSAPIAPYNVRKETATPHKMRNCGLILSFYDTKSKIIQ